MRLQAVGKCLVLMGLMGVAASAMADSTPQDFSVLTTNISNLEYQILRIVQLVVTLVGILLAFRGVIHLKQHAHGSPQEKHLPKGLANIIFAAILFMVVPLIHMLVGTLGTNLGQNSAYNTAWEGGEGAAGIISTAS